MDLSLASGLFGFDPIQARGAGAIAAGVALQDTRKESSPTRSFSLLRTLLSLFGVMSQGVTKGCHYAFTKIRTQGPGMAGCLLPYQRDQFAVAL